MNHAFFIVCDSIHKLVAWFVTYCFLIWSVLFMFLLWHICCLFVCFFLFLVLGKNKIVSFVESSHLFLITGLNLQITFISWYRNNTMPLPLGYLMQTEVFLYNPYLCVCHQLPFFPSFKMICKLLLSRMFEKWGLNLGLWFFFFISALVIQNATVRNLW